LLVKEVGELIERSATMVHYLYPLLIVALGQQLPSPLPQTRASSLGTAIANGAPFVVQLAPGQNNGTLIGGETYIGSYDRGSGTFTVSGRGLREDGAVISLTATYGGADPLSGQVSLWGAGYTFDAQGNLYYGNLTNPVGTIRLRR
jgi:hypothetical protein